MGSSHQTNVPTLQEGPAQLGCQLTLPLNTKLVCKPAWAPSDHHYPTASDPDERCGRQARCFSPSTLTLHQCPLAAAGSPVSPLLRLGGVFRKSMLPFTKPGPPRLCWTNSCQEDGCKDWPPQSPELSWAGHVWAEHQKLAEGQVPCTCSKPAPMHLEDVDRPWQPSEWPSDLLAAEVPPLSLLKLGLWHAGAASSDLVAAEHPSSGLLRLGVWGAGAASQRPCTWRMWTPPWQPSAWPSGRRGVPTSPPRSFPAGAGRACPRQVSKILVFFTFSSSQTKAGSVDEVHLPRPPKLVTVLVLVELILLLTACPTSNPAPRQVRSARLPRVQRQAQAWSAVRFHLSRPPQLELSVLVPMLL